MIKTIYLKKQKQKQDGNKLPEMQSNLLTMANVSALDLTAQLTAKKPFYLIDNETGEYKNELTIFVRTGESYQATIVFDTTFKADLHNQVINSVLNVAYKEHQNNVSQPFFSHLKSFGSIDFIFDPLI